jgi:hypothetical protein
MCVCGKGQFSHNAFKHCAPGSRLWRGGGLARLRRGLPAISVAGLTHLKSQEQHCSLSHMIVEINLI